MKCELCGAEYEPVASGAGASVKAGKPQKYCSVACRQKYARRHRKLIRRQQTVDKNKVEKRYYVYLLRDHDNKPYYVGKGQGDRSRLSRYRHPLPDGSIPTSIKLKENLTEAEAYRYENYFINVFGRQRDGGLLINRDAPDGYTYS